MTEIMTTLGSWGNHFMVIALVFIVLCIVNERLEK